MKKEGRKGERTTLPLFCCILPCFCKSKIWMYCAASNSDNRVGSVALAYRGITNINWATTKVKNRRTKHFRQIANMNGSTA